ncbi:SDR family NAD(P)-dependent oxidoreductase [Rhodococcus sp. T2V]|uniref:SDR family NAD(P)-dependent oxidoreductase n=1 Tax=Rhodococcus sp. T2V TaxID=3034164 RepID=UPI0023E0D077|nr:SDR family oxidoreductase [Rhodococcus sp. T2V]MDF3308217.1 SDR family NAD(P)-dependent oxidoreductase [Rhodococcus sp. T2V]
MTFRLPPVPDFAFPGFTDSCAVVVGGASGGVGSAMVRLLLRAGSAVIVVDRDEQRSKQLAAALGHNESLRTVLTDITTEGGIRDLEAALARPGRPVRHLVNVVGGVTGDDIGHFLHLDSDQWGRALATNVTYALRTSQTVARHMVAERRGSIVNLSVADADRAMPWFAFYGATRSALDSLTRTMAVELGPFGVRANTVSWGLISSPRMHPARTSEGNRERDVIPLGRRGLVADVAGAAMFMLSDLAQYVTGQDLAVDGGLSLCGPQYEHTENIPVFLESEPARNVLRGQFDSIMRDDEGRLRRP